MHPQYKLIRFSNGDQIIGEVLEDKDFSLRVRNMFKVINRETSHGYVTGIIGWLSYLDDEVVVINKEHVTFTSTINNEIVEYIKTRAYEEDEKLSMEDMEQQYKEAMMEYHFRHANTKPTMN